MIFAGSSTVTTSSVSRLIPPTEGSMNISARDFLNSPKRSRSRCRSVVPPRVRLPRPPLTASASLQTLACLPSSGFEVQDLSGLLGRPLREIEGRLVLANLFVVVNGSRVRFTHDRNLVSPPRLSTYLPLSLTDCPSPFVLGCCILAPLS
jgi:hypothetical protein